MRQQSVNFDRAAEFYDATRGFPPGVESQVAEFIRDVANLKPTHRILEIGIGTGRIALPLSYHVDQYFGVDISHAMLARLLQKRTGENILVAQGDAEALAFPAKSLDIIVIVHVLHLVRNPKHVADELARVLKPDGLVLNCIGGHEDGLKPLQDVWSNVTASYRIQRSTFDRNDILPDLGWEQIGDIQTLRYPVTQSPAEFLDAVQNRIWSSTWDMSDEDLNRGVEMIKQVIREHYNDDPNMIVPTERTFNIYSYRPPD